MIYCGIDGGKGFICKDDTLFVSDLDVEEKTLPSGIIIAKDQMLGNCNFQHPRWAKVRYKADNIKDVEVGDWILLYHGNWSTSIRVNINGVDEKLWYINPKSYKEGALAINKTKPF